MQTLLTGYRVGRLQPGAIYRLVLVMRLSGGLSRAGWLMHTRIGGRGAIPMPLDDQLPRIC